ncbi:MAG: AAC(3) family N-acetyltransferase [Lachnospiraceae bacterium]|nr:AAC(3) family N-acetyltransferase [Lachnospiraceae bacterium]
MKDFYREFAASFDLRTGDSVWLSSETVRLAFLCKKNGMRFDPSLLIDAFQSVLGEEGTLLLPVFSFEFSNHGHYDYLHTKGTTGVLGNTALSRGDFRRTLHPMHSFAVWGKDRELLCGMTNTHSFGEDSPFAYCKERNVTQLMLGTDYVHSMTFVHYVETVCRVPYRFAKQFTGTYVTAEGRGEARTCDYAARRPEVGTTEQFNRIGAVLEEKGIATVHRFQGIESRVVQLGKSFDPIREDILHNRCRLLYDFTVSRESLFEGFGEI